MITLLSRFRNPFAALCLAAFSSAFFADSKASAGECSSTVVRINYNEATGTLGGTAPLVGRQVFAGGRQGYTVVSEPDPTFEQPVIHNHELAMCLSQDRSKIIAVAINDDEFPQGALPFMTKRAVAHWHRPHSKKPLAIVEQGTGKILVASITPTAPLELHPKDHAKPTRVAHHRVKKAFTGETAFAFNASHYKTTMKVNFGQLKFG